MGDERAQAEAVEKGKREASEELERIKRQDAIDRDRELYEKEIRAREAAERERAEKDLRN